MGTGDYNYGLTTFLRKVAGASVLVFSLLTGLSQQCRLPADVVFVIDSTYNLNIDYFTNLRSSLQRIVEQLDVDSRRTRIGAISVGGNAVAEFDLSTYRYADEVKQAIGRISYRGTVPNILDAMKLLRSRMFAKGYGARPQGKDGVVRLAVFFLSNSPGVGLEDLEAETRLLREIGLEGVAVGVGNYISNAELEALSSYPPYLNSFQLPTSSNMSSLETNITRVVCGENANCQNAACWSNPERKTGCVELFNRAQCVCKEGFTGNNCSQRCSGGADVIFAVQTSRDLSQPTVQAMMTFVRDVTNSLDLESGGDSLTRVGLLTYEETPYIRLQLGWFVQDKGEILRAMDVSNMNFSYVSAENTQNNLADAIRTAREVMFKDWNGDRATRQNVLVVVFDGKSDNSVACLSEADAARSAGIDIIPVAIGDGMDMEEMKGLAGPTVNETGLLMASSVEALVNKDWIDNVSALICSKRAITFAFTQAEKYGLGFGLGLGGGILLIGVLIIVGCCICNRRGAEKGKANDISGNTVGRKVALRRMENGDGLDTSQVKSEIHPDTVVPIQDQKRLSYEHLDSESRYPETVHNYTPTLPNSPQKNGPSGARSPPLNSPSSPDLNFHPNAKFMAGNDAITLELDALSAGSTPIRSHPLASRTVSPSSPANGKPGTVNPSRGHPLAVGALSSGTPANGKLGISSGPASPLASPSGLTKPPEQGSYEYSYAKDVDWPMDGDQKSYAYAYEGGDSFPNGKTTESINGYLLPVDAIQRPLPPIPDEDWPNSPGVAGTIKRDVVAGGSTTLPMKPEANDVGSVAYDYVLEHSEYSLPIKVSPLPVPNGAKFPRQHSAACTTSEDYLNASEATKGTSISPRGTQFSSTLQPQGSKNTQHNQIAHSTSDTGVEKFRTAGGKDRQQGEVDRTELLRALHMRGNKERDPTENGRDVRDVTNNITATNGHEKQPIPNNSNTKNINYWNTIDSGNSKKPVSKVNSSNVTSSQPSINPKSLRHISSDVGNYPKSPKTGNFASTLPTLQDEENTSRNGKNLANNPQAEGSKGAANSVAPMDFMQELRRRQAEYLNNLDYQPGELYPDANIEKL